MFSRLSQIARHLSTPVAGAAPSLAARRLSLSGFRLGGSIMASSAAEQNLARTIHTAACLIIGDEVLGGKVSHLDNPIDDRLGGLPLLTGFNT